MALQGVLNLSPRPEIAERIVKVVEDLDATIVQIRSTIFGLSQARNASTGLRTQLLDVVADAAPFLGFQPRVSFEGPIDTAVPVDVVPHVLAVAREGLSNAARHAEASSVSVIVRVAGPDVVLEIVDDGRGLGDVSRSSGLSNLSDRAQGLGGSFEVRSEPGAGTQLEWRVPLSVPTASGRPEGPAR
jgi:signal transduction histidine kinase